jgi:hypothetical protein
MTFRLARRIRTVRLMVPAWPESGFRELSDWRWSCMSAAVMSIRRSLAETLALAPVRGHGAELAVLVQHVVIAEALG